MRRHRVVFRVFSVLTSFGAVLRSLASILSKRTLAPGKLDEIKIKANILGAFRPVVEKAEEAQAEAETRDEL